jgi:hypothetical protein
MDKRTLKYRQPERMSFLNTVVFDRSKGEGASDSRDDNDNGYGVTTGASVSFCIPTRNDEKIKDEQEKGGINGITMSNELNETIGGKNDESIERKEEEGNITGEQDQPSDTYPSESMHDKEEGIDPNSGEDGRDGEETGSAFFRRSSGLLEKTSKSIRGTLNKWHSSRDRYRDDYKRTLEVFRQACFYLGAFYLTHVWSTTNRIIQMINNGNTYYGLILVHSL